MVIKWNGGPHRAACSEHRQMEPMCPRPPCWLSLWHQLWHFNKNISAIPLWCLNTDAGVRQRKWRYINLHVPESKIVYTVRVWCMVLRTTLNFHLHFLQQRNNTLSGILVISYTKTASFLHHRLDISSLCPLSVCVMMSGLVRVYIPVSTLRPCILRNGS